MRQSSDTEIVKFYYIIITFDVFEWILIQFSTSSIFFLWTANSAYTQTHTKIIQLIDYIRHQYKLEYSVLNMHHS